MAMNADFRLGEWLIQPGLGRISRDGRCLPLRAKVMDLLVYLSSREGKVASKAELLDAVWGTDAITESALTRTVTELRQAFGDDAENPRVLETIPKRGYRLVMPVSPAVPASEATEHVPAAPPPVVQRHFPRVTVAIVLAALICSVVVWAAAKTRGGDNQDEPWREVTTSSAEARRLFNAGLDAVANPPRDWDAAGPLFARAVAIDPDFASAQIWHAWACHNSDRAQEAIAIANAASVASGHLPVLERQWILSSAAIMRRESERAIEHLAPIVAMQPRHFWALNNLAWEYAVLGQDDRAAEFAVRAALLRPRSPGNQEAAAIRLSALGRRDEAKHFAAKAVRLYEEAGNLSGAQHLRLLPAFDAWLDRRLDEVLRIADSEAAQIADRAPGPPWGGVADSIASVYLWLGRVERASELSFYTPWPKRHRFWIHLHQGSLDEWRTDIAADATGFGDDLKTVVGGPLDVAREIVAKLPTARLTRVDRGRQLALRSILNARSGNTKAAIRELNQALPLLRHSADTYMFLATEMVVPLFGEDLEGAYHALRIVADEKHHLFETFNPDMWQRTRVLEARVARKLGRTAEADAIEQELRELGRLADPCDRNCLRLHLHRN